MEARAGSRRERRPGFSRIAGSQLAACERRMLGLGIREQDLRETFVTSQGKGGQNVNKVATCVVLLHAPSGIAHQVPAGALARAQPLPRAQAARRQARSSEAGRREPARAGDRADPPAEASPLASRQEPHARRQTRTLRREVDARPPSKATATNRQSSPQEQVTGRQQSNGGGWDGSESRTHSQGSVVLRYVPVRYFVSLPSASGARMVWARPLRVMRTAACAGWPGQPGGLSLRSSMRKVAPGNLTPSSSSMHAGEGFEQVVRFRRTQADDDLRHGSVVDGVGQVVARCRLFQRTSRSRHRPRRYAGCAARSRWRRDGLRRRCADRTRVGMASWASRGKSQVAARTIARLDPPGSMIVMSPGLVFLAHLALDDLALDRAHHVDEQARRSSDRSRAAGRVRTDPRPRPRSSCRPRPALVPGHAVLA